MKVMAIDGAVARNTENMDSERSVLRWGGLAGILGGILLIFVFAVVIVFVGDEPATLVGWLERFPRVRTARTVENGAYLLVFILWVPHFLSLYVALRRTSLAPALFGSALGIVGLAVLAAGALPHVATVPLSDIYYAPGATPADQAAIVLMWQASWGIFDALLFAGLGFMAFSIATLGIAMLQTPTFGRGFGWLSMAIGVAGVAAWIAVLIDPNSPLAAVSVLSLILFHLVVGVKVYRLSRAV